MDINFADVEQLIKIAENSRIGGLEISDGHQTIRITCQAPQANNVNTCSSSPGYQATLQNYPDNTPEADSGKDHQPQATPANLSATKNNSTKEVMITSPMVGTFYRKSSPDVPDFVDIGSTVNANQTLCIIEAMKIMHEVKAEKSGKITAILVDDGAMVEYGEPIFSIREV